MTSPNLNTPLGHWIEQHPETARIFDSLQIDYSSDDAAPLELACWERQLCPQQVASELELAIHAAAHAATRSHRAASPTPD